MIIEIILAIIIGVALGTFTGLAPGIHINLVSVLIITLSPFLLTLTTPLNLAVVIVAMSVTHTFLDAIPSIYLGAPDSDEVLSVLPGHKMLLQGNAYHAVVLNTIGSLASLVVIVSLVPVMIPLVVKFYPVIASYIGYILIATSLFMILREKQKVLVLIIFLLSGALGLGVFNLGLKDPLFPLLSGLFGISGLLLSIKNKVKIPVQRISYPQVRKSAGFQAIAATLFSGTLTSFLPGFSSAQAAILGSSVTKNIGDEGYLILVGGANTVNMILSVVALYVIDKARNGSIIAVSKLLGTLTKDNLILILACILVVGGIATILTLKLSKVFSGIISKVNYKLLCVSIISLIILLTFVLTGPMGFLVLVVSTSLGIIPQLKNIGRNHTMGCLLIPVILYFTL